MKHHSLLSNFGDDFSKFDYVNRCSNFFEDTKLGFRFSAEFLKAQSEINEAANSIFKPLAFFHGTGDDTCPTLGSIEYYDAVPNEEKNKELFLFEGMRHEPFEDPEFELFFEKFTNWFQSQI